MGRKHWLDAEVSPRAGAGRVILAFGWSGGLADEGDRMRRRELILLIGGAAIATRSARPQQPAWTPVIGFLGIGSASRFSDGLTAFRDGLRSRGFVDGQNAAIEYRWAAGDAARLPVLAAELVQARVDVIAASGGPLPALAAEDATRTIPIVSSSAAKVVASFARPGANVTGVVIE